jgi:hypothetical protein
LDLIQVILSNLLKVLLKRKKYLFFEFSMNLPRIQSIPPVKTFRLNDHICNAVRNALCFQSMTLNLYDPDNYCLRNASYGFEEGFIHLLPESQYLIEWALKKKGKVELSTIQNFWLVIFQILYLSTYSWCFNVSFQRDIFVSQNKFKISNRESLTSNLTILLSESKTSLIINRQEEIYWKFSWLQWKLHVHQEWIYLYICLIFHISTHLTKTV